MLRIAQALDTQLRRRCRRAFPEVDALLIPSCTGKQAGIW